MAVSQPPLPAYIDEKAAVPSSARSSFDEANFEGLQVGRPTVYSRLEQRITRLSRTRKVFLGIATAWLGVSLVRTIHGRGHGYHHRGEGCTFGRFEVAEVCLRHERD